MKLKLIKRGTEAELLMEGQLDTVTSPEVDKIMMQLVGQYDTLILNMAKLSYVSSSGLRVFKRAHMGMMKKHGSLQLKNVNEMIMEVFEMTGFSGILTIL